MFVGIDTNKTNFEEAMWGKFFWSFKQYEELEELDRQNQHNVFIRGSRIWTVDQSRMKRLTTPKSSHQWEGLAGGPSAVIGPPQCSMNNHDVSVYKYHLL